MRDLYKVLAYSPDDGWNLRGVHPTNTAAREAARTDVPQFRYVAVILVRVEPGKAPTIAVPCGTAGVMTGASHQICLPDAIPPMVGGPPSGSRR